MRFATRFGAFALAAFVVVSSAGASSFPGKNGKLVYARGGKGTGRIFSSNADGSKTKRLTHPTSSPGDFDPQVSADGKRIVFLRGTKRARQIWIVSTVGTGAHQVKISGLPTKTEPWGPTFTPSGKTIIFELDKGFNRLGIWSVPATGGKARQVMKGNYYAPTVSPNGRKLAFMSGGKIEIASITGKNVKTVYDAPADSLVADAPDFSPDGKQLAFEVIDVGTESADIAVVSSAGGTPTSLTDNSSGYKYDRSPAFSPDGTTIAFIHSDDSVGTWEVDKVPASGGSTSVVLPASSAVSFVSLDWQPK